MHKKCAKLFGIIFILIGFLGFVPGITTHGYLLGTFHVNTLLNVVHLATGVIGYWTSRTSLQASLRFFQIFGFIYVAIALFGFGYGNRDIFGILASSRADTWLHLISGIVFLYCSFFYKGK